MSSWQEKQKKDADGAAANTSSKEESIGRSLLHALRNTGISVIYQDGDLCVLWAHNVPPSWGSDEIVGKTDHEFLPTARADELITAKKAVLSSGHPKRMEISLSDKDGVHWFAVWVDADRNPDGSALAIITTAVDITEHKRREQTLKTLLREVAHRSKNLLAIIQSIATQTGRYSSTIDVFLSRFRGRLQSLSSSQDLVTSSNWRGADLHELVLGQVGRYRANPKRSVRFEGEKPYLNPNAALHIGLAMHELAVNSVSYGALAQPGGFVTVTATMLPQHETSALTLCWSEAIKVADEATRQKRFGSIALERVVPASLNGTGSLQFADGKLDYLLVIPRANFEID